MKRFFTGPVREGCYHLHFFLTALSSCAYGSFLNVYLGDLGYGAMVIGLFSTVPSLLGLLLQPLLAAWTDRTRRKMGAMACLTAVSAGAMALMLLLRPRYGPDSFSAGVLMAVHTGYLAFSGAANALNTAVLMRHLSAQGASDRYGRIRVSWTAGFAVGGVWVGRISQAAPAGFIPFAVAAALLSLAVLPLLPWRQVERLRAAESGPKGRVSFRSLMGYRELWCLTGIVFMIALANSFTYTFLPTFFMTLPGADNEAFGWCISLRTVTEVPVLLGMGWIMGRLGVKKTLLIPAVSTVIRWLLVALFPTPGVVLATQLLHGFGYVVYSVAMTRYVADTLPDAIGGTAQNLVALLTVTLPTLAGGLLGGLVIETWGLGYMACIGGMIALDILALAALIVLLLRRPDDACEKDKGMIG